jgi:hypothetical protein
MWYVHDGAPCCARYSLSWPTDRYMRTHCMASTLTWLESSGFLPVGTLKHPCVCSSCWQRRDTSPLHCGCLSDYPQLPRSFCTDVAVHVETCRGVSRRVLNLMRDVLSTYCKCTLLAINHKLNISGHILIWTFFLVLECGTRVQSLSAPFRLHSAYINDSNLAVCVMCVILRSCQKLDYVSSTSIKKNDELKIIWKGAVVIS